MLENYPGTLFETIGKILKLLESDKTGPQRRDLKNQRNIN
jgi:hypothetical protein